MNNINHYLKINKISISSLSKSTGIPYTTINELVNGKTKIDHASVRIVRKLAEALNLDIRELSELCDTSRLHEKIVIKNKQFYLRTQDREWKLFAATLQNRALLEKILNDRSTSFQTFRNELHHRIKMNGDINTVITIIRNNYIPLYYETGRYVEALYLLSYVDYILQQYHSPVPAEYRDYRTKKLDKPFFIGDCTMIDRALHTDCNKEKLLSRAIPEFLKHNIVEVDLYDAV